MTVMVNETLDTRDSFVMPNPKGHEDSIKDSRFKAAWHSGPTRTIRVPIALADATLDYARQLDRRTESHDTSINDNIKANSVVAESHDTRGKITNQLSNLVDFGGTGPHDTGSTLSQKLPPDAAMMLSKLRAKRKKSKVELADVEALLELLD
jgi:hypothetical protein